MLSPSSRSRLPAEIIHQILGYIPDDDWAIRNGLARTSPHFHHQLTYSLYGSAPTTGHRIRG